MNGWIKLHRKLIDSPVFDNEKALKVWVWCLLRANHQEKEVLVGLQNVTLQPGEFVTGRNKASEELGLTPSTAWRYLNLLRKLEMLDIKPNSKFSVISLVNWGKYQGSETDNGQQSEQQMDNKRTANGQQMDTDKNVKKEKNDKEQDKRASSKPPAPTTVDDAITLHAERYTDKQLRLIRKYWETMKYLRKTDTISPNIVDKRMTYWEQFPVPWVQQALVTHLQGHATKRENYTDGILRGLREEHQAKGKGVTDAGGVGANQEASRDDARYLTGKYAHLVREVPRPRMDHHDC